MKILQSLAAGIAAVTASSAAAQSVPSEPAYQVVDHEIAILDLRVTLKVPEDAVYLGAKRWALYDVADAELDHVRLGVRRREGVQAARDAIYSRGPIRPVIKHLFDALDFSGSGRAGRGRDQRANKKAA